MKKIHLVFIFIFLFFTKQSFALQTSNEGLQNCTPGSYSLTLPSGLISLGNSSQIVYQVTGMENDKCRITITGSYIPPGKTQSSHFTLICALSPNDLSKLNQSMQTISLESITLPNIINNPIVSILKSSCKKTA